MCAYEESQRPNSNDIISSIPTYETIREYFTNKETYTTEYTKESIPVQSTFVSAVPVHETHVTTTETVVETKPEKKEEVKVEIQPTQDRVSEQRVITTSYTQPTYSYTYAQPTTTTYTQPYIQYTQPTTTYYETKVETPSEVKKVSETREVQQVYSSYEPYRTVVRKSLTTTPTTVEKYTTYQQPATYVTQVSTPQSQVVYSQVGDSQYQSKVYYVRANPTENEKSLYKAISGPITQPITEQIVETTTQAQPYTYTYTTTPVQNQIVETKTQAQPYTYTYTTTPVQNQYVSYSYPTSSQYAYSTYPYTTYIQSVKQKETEQKEEEKVEETEQNVEEVKQESQAQETKEYAYTQYSNVQTSEPVIQKKIVRTYVNGVLQTET